MAFNGAGTDYSLNGQPGQMGSVGDRQQKDNGVAIFGEATMKVDEQLKSRID